jgi:hypothetical protein
MQKGKGKSRENECRRARKNDCRITQGLNCPAEPHGLGEGFGAGRVGGNPRLCHLSIDFLLVESEANLSAEKTTSMSAEELGSLS